MAKNNNVNPNLLLAVGSGFLAYTLFLKPLTNLFGLTKNATTENRDNQNKTAETLAGWNPNYWKSISGKKRVFSADAIAALATEIKNAWGFFNDNEEQIYSVFRKLQSTVQLSQLVESYTAIAGEDLLARLQSGLSKDEFNNVANIVNALPKNVT